jgi:hypothetical protein
VASAHHCARLSHTPRHAANTTSCTRPLTFRETRFDSHPRHVNDSFATAQRFCAQPLVHPRLHRQFTGAALREFYGLKNAPKDADAKISEESTRTELGPDDDETLTELDAADFNADAFVDSILAREGLQGVLKVEADLVSRECGARHCRAAC